jgi:hypothetical protein
VLRDLHDEVLNLSCAFALDAAGTPRCFPQHTQREGTLVFEDAACQQPAVWLYDLKPGDWFTEDPPRGSVCEVGLQRRGPLFEVGEFLGEPEPWISPDHHPAYALRDGRCEPTAPATKGQLPLHRLIPHRPSELVAGALVSSPGTSELRVMRIVAEDGAQLNLHATLANTASCKLLSDGSCVPEPFAQTSWGLWLDADCSAPAMDSPCGPPRFGVVVDGAGQERVVELRVQAGFLRDYLSFVPVDGSTEPPCMPATGSVSTFAAGRDMSGTLPKAEPLALGQGELRSDAFRVGSYVLQSARELGPEFRDLQGRPCGVEEAPNGTLHCVAYDVRVMDTGYRADPTCSTRLYARADAAKVPFTPELLARSLVIEYGLENLSSVRLHHGDVYASNGGECLRVAPDEPNLRELFGELPTALLVPDQPLSVDIFPKVEVVRL